MDFNLSPLRGKRVTRLRSSLTEPLAGKSSWPEQVGTNGDAAVTIIMNENPNVEAITVKEGSYVTEDYRCDRVRVWGLMTPTLSLGSPGSANRFGLISANIDKVAAC